MRLRAGYRASRRRVLRYGRGCALFMSGLALCLNTFYPVTCMLKQLYSTSTDNIYHSTYTETRSSYNIHRDKTITLIRLNRETQYLFHT